jgi:hypothetical protein
MEGFSDELKIYGTRIEEFDDNARGVRTASSLTQEILESFDNQYLPTGRP